MSPEKKKTEEDKALLDEKKAEAKAAQGKKAASSGTTKKATVKKTSTSTKKSSPKKTTSAEASSQKAVTVEVVAKESKTEEPKPKERVVDKEPAQSGFDRGALILGGGMLVMGFILLLGRLLHIPFGDFIWPFIFIVPGVLVFATALSTESSSGEGLSILGGILTMLGFLFLAQSITNLWASWAYAWTLVAPTSIGLSQMVYGMRKNRDAIVQSGRKLANLGMGMFVIGFVFFELILGISGFGLARFGLPVFPMMLIFAGLVVLVNSFLRNR